MKLTTIAVLWISTNLFEAVTGSGVLQEYINSIQKDSEKVADLMDKLAKVNWSQSLCKNGICEIDGESDTVRRAIREQLGRLIGHGQEGITKARKRQGDQPSQPEGQGENIIVDPLEPLEVMEVTEEPFLPQNDITPLTVIQSGDGSPKAITKAALPQDGAPSSVVTRQPSVHNVPSTLTDPPVSTSAKTYFNNRTDLSDTLKGLLGDIKYTFWTEERAQKAKKVHEDRSLFPPISPVTDHTIPNLQQDDLIFLDYLLSVGFPDDANSQKEISQVVSSLYLKLLGVEKDNVSNLVNPHTTTFSDSKNHNSWSVEKKIRNLMLNNSRLAEDIIPPSKVSVDSFLNWVYACQNANAGQVAKMSSYLNRSAAIPKKFICHFPFAVDIYEQFGLQNSDDNKTAAKTMVTRFIEMYKNDEWNKVAKAITLSYYEKFVEKFYENIPKFCTLADGCQKTQDQYID
jgi:hypothetical protein